MPPRQPLGSVDVSCLTTAHGEPADITLLAREHPDKTTNCTLTFHNPAHLSQTHDHAGQKPRQPRLIHFLSNNTSLSHGLAAGEKIVKSTSFEQFNSWLSPFQLTFPFFLSFFLLSLFFFFKGGLLGKTMKPRRASRDKRCDVVSASSTRTTQDSTTQGWSPLSHHPLRRSTNAFPAVPVRQPQTKSSKLAEPDLISGGRTLS